MAFDWREYLVLAKWLAANPPPAGVSQEATYRCAISRVYFAAYGHAFDYATQYLAFTPRNDSDDHGRLRDHLKRSKRRGTADSLDRLREWRNTCDYDAEIPGDLAAILGNAVSEAEYVFNSLPPPAPRPQTQP